MPPPPGLPITQYHNNERPVWSNQWPKLAAQLQDGLSIVGAVNFQRSAMSPVDQVTRSPLTQTPFVDAPDAAATPTALLDSHAECYTATVTWAKARLTAQSTAYAAQLVRITALLAL